MKTSTRFSFSSSLPLLSLALLTGLFLSTSGTGCGANQACFYWTQAEGSCPSQKEALDFFQGNNQFCQSGVTSVDSEGTFDGDVCCYDVTEVDNSFGGDCFIEPGPPPPNVTTSVGSGGAAGMGGFGGAGGAGGTGGSDCSGCAAFFTNTNPPPLCANSVPLYEALTDCECQGPCASACGQNVCLGMPSDTPCDMCLLNQNTGCGMLVSQCLNDN